MHVKTQKRLMMWHHQKKSTQRGFSLWLNIVALLQWMNTILILSICSFAIIEMPL